MDDESESEHHSDQEAAARSGGVNAVIGLVGLLVLLVAVDAISPVIGIGGILGILFGWWFAGYRAGRQSD